MKLKGYCESGGRLICAVKTEGEEFAWRIDEVSAVIEKVREEGRVILGGDVLGPDMTCTYDNWHYTPKNPWYYNLKNPAEDSKLSCEKAQSYVQWYLDRFGPEFYVVLVIE